MNLAVAVFAERFTELVDAAFRQLWASGGCLPSINVHFWVLAWTVSNAVITLSHTRIVGVVLASAFMLCLSAHKHLRVFDYVRCVP